MTYLFSNTVNVSNEVEIKNDTGNPIPVSGNVSINYKGLPVDEYTNRFPVTLGSESVIITGNVNIIPTVNVASSPQNPVHTHITEVGNSGIIITNYLPIGGNVSILNYPSVQTVNGTINIGNSLLVNVGNYPSVQTVNGTINIGNSIIANVGNFPQTQNVYITNTPSNPVPITGNVVVNSNEDAPVLVKFVDRTNVQLDTQQRLRVSIQGQQWWYVSSVDKDGDLRFVEKFSGANANSYFLQNFASVKITSGTDSNGSAIRASRRRHKIRPGISHQYVTVHNFDGIQPNTIKRVGIFTNYNGMFMEVSDDLYFVVRRRLLDGTLVEDRYPRSQFNQDVLNGTGPSELDFTSNTNVTINLSGYVSSLTKNVSVGYANSAPVSNTQIYNVTYSTSNTIPSSVTLGTKVTVSGVSPITFNGPALIQNIDNANNKVTLSYSLNPGTYSSMSSGKLLHTMFNNSYTWWIDFNGGRTGILRFGVNSPVGPVVLHICNYSGTISEQYESAPALMDRIELVNTGTVNYVPSLTTHGTTFNTEAEVELNPSFGTALASIPISFSKNANEEFAILGIGLRAGEPYQRADMQIQGISMMDLSNLNLQNSTVYQWRLVLNPTLTGSVPPPQNVGKAARFWDYPQGITVSGGIDLMGGYVFASQNIDVRTSLNFLNMGSNIDYTDTDIAVFVVKQLVRGTADGSIIAGLNFIEAL